MSNIYDEVFDILMKYVEYDNWVIRYQAWYKGGMDHSCLFDDREDAIKFAKENGCNEVEAVIWHDEEKYENYKPADEFAIVWRA